MVVQACANDYEDFEMIVSEVAKWTKSKFKTPGISEIEDALLMSITEGNVIAYEYSETLRRFVAKQAAPQNIRTLWFCITEECKKRLDEEM